MEKFWRTHKYVIIAGVIVAVIILVWENRQAILSKLKN